jgi:hypothetical protein
VDSGIRRVQTHGSEHRPWLTKLLERRPPKVAAIAPANKLARSGATNRRDDDSGSGGLS